MSGLQVEPVISKGLGQEFACPWSRVRILHMKNSVYEEPCTLDGANCVTFLNKLKQLRSAIDEYLRIVLKLFKKNSSAAEPC